jgi:hypothetical protein
MPRAIHGQTTSRALLTNHSNQYGQRGIGIRNKLLRHTSKISERVALHDLDFTLLAHWSLLAQSLVGTSLFLAPILIALMPSFKS